jgi:hypothetical protein
VSAPDRGTPGAGEAKHESIYLACPWCTARLAAGLSAPQRRALHAEHIAAVRAAAVARPTPPAAGPAAGADAVAELSALGQALQSDDPGDYAQDTIDGLRDECDRLREKLAEARAHWFQRGVREGRAQAQQAMREALGLGDDTGGEP